MLKAFKTIMGIKATLIAGSVLILSGLVVAAAGQFFGIRPLAAGVESAGAAFQSDGPGITNKPSVKGVPSGIQITAVDIDLKVAPGYYYPSSRSWTLSMDRAQYGVMTAPANNKEGLTFIYAHYRKGMFLTLPKVKTGDIASITTNNGHTFKYAFRTSIVTSPEDTSLFDYKGKPILVLQTCNGLWYQNRQLFIFDFVEAD